MQNRPFDILANLKVWLANYLPNAIVGVLWALGALIVILIIYRITKRLIRNAMLRKHNTEAEIRQFTTMWKYMFML